MRIESINQFTPQLLLSEQLNLKEGSVIRGEILEQSTDRVLLRVNNNVIEAMLDGTMEDVEGKFLNFFVSSDSQGRIVLKLQSTEDQILSSNIVDSSLSKLLDELGAEKNEKTVEIIRNMMTFSIPTDKKNVQEVLNLQSKVELLMNLKETDHVFVIKNSLEELAELLSQQSESILWKEKLLSKDSILGKTVKAAFRQGFSEIELFREMRGAKSVSEAYQKVDQLTKNLIENKKNVHVTKETSSFSIQKIITDIDGMDVESISQLNIENLLISEKNTTKNMVDIRQSVQNFFKNNLEISNTELSRIFSFFKKHDISFTLGNFKTMLQYLEQPDRLFQVFQKLDHVFKKDPEMFSSLFFQRTEVENSIETQSLNLQDILSSPEILGKIEKLYPNEEGWKENIRFILDLNKDLNFMFFPFNPDFQMKGGFIHYLKQRQEKKVDYQKSLNIMINVETHHIGNVKVFCRANNKKLDIKLKIREEDVRLFDSNVESLTKSIEKLGFEISPIKYIFDDKYNLLDLQMESATSSYFLDLRV